MPGWDKVVGAGEKLPGLRVALPVPFPTNQAGVWFTQELA